MPHCWDAAKQVKNKPKATKSLVRFTEKPVASVQKVEEISDLAEPEIHTSSDIEDRIKITLGCTKIKLNPSSTEAKSKHVMKNKINIPFDEQTYKGLINLQVSEDDICSNVPSKYKDLIKNREPEPILSDYYKPEFKKEYIVKPNPPIFEVKKQFFRGGSHVLDSVKRWEML